MTTRYFDEPLLVQYRDGTRWYRVLDLGVRRSGANTYHVLIVRGHSEGAENMSWVPRARIRVEDTALTCAGTA